MIRDSDHNIIVTDDPENVHMGVFRNAELVISKPYKSWICDTGELPCLVYKLRECPRSDYVPDWYKRLRTIAPSVRYHAGTATFEMDSLTMTHADAALLVLMFPSED